MNQTALTDFGIRYAAAWSSQNPVCVASFYNEKRSLTANGGAPSVGRTAITETASGFMTALPDMSGAPRPTLSAVASSGHNSLQGGG